MRWISLCAVLGAVLLPAVSARPLCRPDVTTTPVASSTPSATPVPTPENLILNGDFEEEDLSVWSLRTVTVEKDAAKAHSPDHYVRYFVQNEYAVGGNNLNQTINGLDTTRLYRLSFSAAVFGSPSLGAASCSLDALQGDTVFKSWNIDTYLRNRYKSYDTEFLVNGEDITFTLRLRCSVGVKVTIDIGVDDIVMTDIGPARI
ncbi:hypothetical protein AUP68_02417 [Ilyonectria robusta]